MIRTRLDYVIDRIVGSSDKIIGAHLDLGVPLEDCICSVVRTALRIAEDDPRQLLIFNERIHKEKSDD